MLFLTIILTFTLGQSNLCEGSLLTDVFSGDSIDINQPELPNRNLPDLTNITNIISRNEFFYDQNPSFRAAVRQLALILLAIVNKTEFIEMVSQLRNDPELNPSVLNRAVISAIINRQDRSSFQIPSLIEVQPDLVLSNDILNQLESQLLLPASERSCVIVDGSSGLDNGIENLLWYFREDVMVNSHHWFWHLYYPFDTGVGDRRGELFYSMHHSFIARYSSERISNSLPPIPSYILQKTGRIPEAYYSHLTQMNAKQDWTDRPSFQPIPDTCETSFINMTIDEVLEYRRRILESIDNGNLLMSNGSYLQIRNLDGIDAVGNIVEASSTSVNPAYYGRFGYHNSGHIFIGNVMHPHDPTDEFPPGVMSDTATAMRDIIFYRWHKAIDEIYERHKNTLIPYQPTGGELPLSWSGIYIDQVTVKSLTSPTTPLNSLNTFWSYTTYNLTNGLDFQRNSTIGQGPVQVCVKHLNHEEFQYNIKIRNTNGPTGATVRIFLAPRYNIYGIRHTMAEQHLLFFALDTFSVNLNTGDNTIIRKSIDSTLTISSRQGLDELNNDQARSRIYCGCGWPHHMLLPKGKSYTGMTYDLFVMVTKELDSTIPPLVTAPPLPVSTEENTCQESYLYCGSQNSKYPDSRPMGYPFDRLPYNVTDYVIPFPPLLPFSRMVRDLDEYKKPSTNMGSTQIKLYHVDNLAPLP